MKHKIKMRGNSPTAGGTGDIKSCDSDIVQNSIVAEGKNKDNGKIVFDVTPLQYFFKKAGLFLSSVATFGICKYNRDINYEKWKAEHTVFIDKSQTEHICRFDGEAGEWKKIYFKCCLLKISTNGILSPLASFYKCEYFVSHTLIDGKRLRYDRTKEDVIKQLKKDVWRAFITLDLYWTTIPYRTMCANLAAVFFDKNAENVKDK